jgi:cell division transport system ATP-binding protein
MKLLDRINRTGTTIVMATHDHAIVDAMRRRVVALEGGRVVRDDETGGYEAVRAAPAAAFVGEETEEE